MKRNFILAVFALAAIILPFSACNLGNTVKEGDIPTDSTIVTGKDTSTVQLNSGDTSSTNISNQSGANQKKAEQPLVFIYNFHITNRCVSCIAIEEATTKTLNTYFSAELKQGRIKRQILNVDSDVNSKIAEKYQAFGSSLFITRVYKGSETTTDLTGDGFKYAKNKEERFIEILKSKIIEYLK